MTDTWDGDRYQRRFDELEAAGKEVHGEAAFVMRFAPGSVLDAGCGTGRVAIEMARRGAEVVGVDVEESMIAVARRRAPEITWHVCDLAQLDLGRRFDVVVMAGNVPLFTPPGTQSAIVAGCTRHVDANGVLITGFQLDRGYGLREYDEACARSGFRLVHRYATWDGDPFSSGDYAVSVHAPA